MVRAVQTECRVHFSAVMLSCLLLLGGATVSIMQVAAFFDVTVVRRLIQFRNATSKDAVLAHRCFALKVESM